MKNDPNYFRAINFIIDSMPLNLCPVPTTDAVTDEVKTPNLSVRMLAYNVLALPLIPKDGSPVRLCINKIWLEAEYRWGTNGYNKTGWMNSRTGNVLEFMDDDLTDWAT